MELLSIRALRFNEARTTLKCHLLLLVLYYPAAAGLSQR